MTVDDLEQATPGQRAATALARARLLGDPAAGHEADRCVAVLPVGQPALAGHYPGYPIVPGVFLMDLVAAAEARRDGERDLGERWVGVRSVRFRAPVFPGQRIGLERSARRGVPRWTLAHPDGTVVAVVDLDLTPGERPPLPDGAAPAVSPGRDVSLPSPEQVLPHRSPMLLLDRVERVERGRSLTATWTVVPTAGGADPADVAPGLPWPLAIESWAQAAAMLTTWDEPTPDVRAGSVLLFGGARDLRFGVPAPPSTTLVHEVHLTADSGGAAVLSGSTWSAQGCVLQVGQLTIGRRPASALPEPAELDDQEVAR